VCRRGAPCGVGPEAPLLHPSLTTTIGLLGPSCGDEPGVPTHSRLTGVLAFRLRHIGLGEALNTRDVTAWLRGGVRTRGGWRRRYCGHLHVARSMRDVRSTVPSERWIASADVWAHARAAVGDRGVSNRELQAASPARHLADGEVDVCRRPTTDGLSRRRSAQPPCA